MKSTAPKRSHDEIKIPNGRYFEACTPAVGPIVTNRILDKEGQPRQLRYAKIQVSVDANVTFRDGGGGQANAVPLKAGIKYDFLVTEVSVVSVGTLYLIHDGEIVLTKDDERA